MDETIGKECAVWCMCNPYQGVQGGALVGRPFWKKEQSLIYVDILKAKKNLFVVVKSIDITLMEKDPAYFGEAVALCHRWGLIAIITFNKDYDVELVAQLYATVHFHANEERSMSWRAGRRRFKVDWKDFMDCLGIADEG